MTVLEKEWIFLDKNIDMAQAEAYSELFEIPLIVAKTLLNRGLTNAADAKRFIDKDLNSFYPPMLLRDMDKAVERIRKAIENKEHVTVYGDYDVDGITSTALLISYLRSCGIEASAYIPDRQDEGYGINMAAVKKIKDGGATLIFLAADGKCAGFLALADTLRPGSAGMIRVLASLGVAPVLLTSDAPNAAHAIAARARNPHPAHRVAQHFRALGINLDIVWRVPGHQAVLRLLKKHLLHASGAGRQEG